VDDTLGRVEAAHASEWGSDKQTFFLNLKMHKKMKQLFILMLFAAAMAGCKKDNTPKTVATWDISATAADKVTATITGTTPNYTLTISGTGKMQDFLLNVFNGSNTVDVPWWGMKDTIKTIVINAGVTSIGSFVFYQCSGLTSITALNPTPLASSASALSTNHVFDFIKTDVCVLKVPKASVAAYKTAAQWKDFATIEGI
jgi:hypothetical protein